VTSKGGPTDKKLPAIDVAAKVLAGVGREKAAR
jgi:hypothetical protein